jgi:two-component system sensor histidine kinase YesM
MFVGTTNREYLSYSLTPEKIYEANGAALWEVDGENNYICMCRAILSTSTMLPQGYMVIVCKGSYVSSCLSTVPSVYGSSVYLLDEERKVAASSDTEAIGEFLDDQLDSRNSYIYETDVLSNGWILVTSMTKEKVREDIILNFLVVGFFLLLMLSIFILLCKLAIRELAEPTKVLVRSMNAFGEGDLSARVAIRSRDEIAEIGMVYNEMADNIEKLLNEVYSLEIANKEAEIEYLKMQITPHFLYNTLDTISWLGFTNGCEEITNLAVALADLLRSSIKNNDIITVKQELNTVRDYLYIQNHRFEDRFETEYAIDEEAYDRYMPNFILQPLIENSIIHGLESQLTKGILKVSIHLEGKWLRFSVSDNGKGMSAEQIEDLMKQCHDMKSRNSIGLKNVYRRLELMYHGTAEFCLSSNPEEGTCISFRIPSDVTPE